MELNIEIPRKISLAYGAACKGLCRELDLPQTAFDILMFLGNNPAYKTASEIVELRHIKANLISVHVERLVQEGYLIRRPSPTDRRKTELFCTEKALPVIRRGRQLQADFLEKVFADTDQETRQEGYLIRRPSPTDRRKTELFCTEKALPVIRRGRQLQADFLEKVFADTDQETRRAFASLMRRIEENLDTILEGK